MFPLHLLTWLSDDVRHKRKSFPLFFHSFLLFLYDTAGLLKRDRVCVCCIRWIPLDSTAAISSASFWLWDSCREFPFWTLVSFNLAHNFITSYKTNDLADMLYYIVIMVPRWLTRLAGMLRSSRNIFTWMVMTIEVYKQTTLSVIAYLPYFLHSSSFPP